MIFCCETWKTKNISNIYGMSMVAIEKASHIQKNEATIIQTATIVKFGGFEVCPSLWLDSTQFTCQNQNKVFVISQFYGKKSIRCYKLSESTFICQQWQEKKLTHSSISTLLQQISLFPNHVAIDLVHASTSFPPQPKETKHSSSKLLSRSISYF